MMTKFLLTGAFMALVIGFSACIEPVPDPSPDYKKIPMTLEKEELSDGSVRLKWSKTPSFEFVEYWVARSLGKDSVPYISVAPTIVPNSVIIPAVEIMSRIPDVDSTGFVDSVTFLNQKVSYRLFAVMNGRVLSSNSVTVGQKFITEEINNIADEIVSVPERRQLLLVNRTQSIITLLSPMAGNTTISTFQGSNLGSEITYRMVSSAANDIEFVFPFRGFASIRNFINPNFSSSFSSNIFMSGVTFVGNSYILDSTNLVIVAPTSFSNFQTTYTYFSMVRPPNNQVGAVLGTRLFTIPQINSIAATNFKQNRFAQREAIGITALNDKTRLQIVNWQANGAITLTKEIDVETNQITQQPFVFSRDSKIFLSNTEGGIFDKTTLKLTGSLKSITKANYLDYTFSEDGTRVYALRNFGNNRANRLIDVFIYPNISLEKSIPFVTQPTRIFQFNSQLLLVGRSPNNSTQTMIERKTI